MSESEEILNLRKENAELRATITFLLSRISSLEEKLLLLLKVIEGKSIKKDR